MKLRPLTGSPPMPTQVVWPMPRAASIARRLHRSACRSGEMMPTALPLLALARACGCSRA